jgi:protein-L-isoaspartate(D-aspartate) O-methyltransferase
MMGLAPMLAAVVFLGSQTVAVDAPKSSAAAERQSARRAMVEEIEDEIRVTRRDTGLAALDPLVREAMLAVPRHELVPSRSRDRAYENRPLPIGYGQTISQPYIVALMTDLLQPAADVVLEVGTGSGYQAAVLAEIVGRVYSVEIVPELARRGAGDLARLGYRNVEVRNGDGYHGWEEHAPFDAIVVTAAASHIPPPLVQQLAPGGRMVIPVGSPFAVQQLTLVEKTPEGRVETRQLLPVSFVPLHRER